MDEKKHLTYSIAEVQALLERAGKVGDPETLLTENKQTLVGAINELFTCAGDGKNVIAAAITGKGVPTQAKSSFADMAKNIEKISGISLEPLNSPAAAENIQMGLQAYDSDGNVIEGNRDFEGEIQSLTDENASLSNENSGLSAQITELEARAEEKYQEGYNNGYNAGYADGSGGVRPLTYSWDESTLTLTITEAA